MPLLNLCALQMFIGDGAKMVRDAFALAKEKSPCIIFIDEVRGGGNRSARALSRG
jgi:26S proteasome regulatory subunit T5